MRNLLRLIPYLKYPTFFNLIEKNGICFACGNVGQFKEKKILKEDLVKEWGIDQQIRTAFDQRESLECNFCGSTLRVRKLAQAILKIYGRSSEKSVKELVSSEYFNKLKIAEINSCGGLHNILSDLKNLSYSEYYAESKNVQFEDIQKLSYKEKSFDLVITSDTLEHVPDLDRSLEEVYRVLREGGYHIFTVPCLLDRKTKERIITENGKTKKILTDSFHGDKTPDYLVYREFGFDLIKKIKEKKFKVKIFFYNFLRQDFSFVFVSRKD